MTRQFVGNLFAVAMSTCASLAFASQSLSSESGKQSNIDSEFTAAVSNVASLRETNRSTAIVVTNLFKQITAKHQLSEFQGFVASQYKLVRAKDALGNVEFADIDADSLRKIDRRFFAHDKLRIAFGYDADRKYIVDMQVSLLNDGGI